MFLFSPRWRKTERRSACRAAHPLLLSVHRSSGARGVDRTILIAGAGQAGGSAAAMLRQLGWQGTVTLIGEEHAAPYQRPPLSKAWLTGEETAESVALRPAGFWAAADIGLRFGTRVIGIDRAARTVALSDGGVLAYDILILALGARPRPLPVPGAALALRSVADADRLKAALRPGARLAIAGGGFIGLEVAASARALGVEVTVIEREDRVLARVACPLLSGFLPAPAIRPAASGSSPARRSRRSKAAAAGSSGVRLGDGRLIACDSALAAIGAVPNDEIAQAAGLTCENGIVVDLAARTDDPAIFAIGDCTRRPLPLYGRMGRLESVPNAIEQARQAAAPDLRQAAAGAGGPLVLVRPVRPAPADCRPAVRCRPSSRCAAISVPAKFAVFHLAADGTVQAVEAVNAAAEFMGGRRIILRRKRLTRAR